MGRIKVEHLEKITETAFIFEVYLEKDGSVKTNFCAIHSSYFYCVGIAYKFHSTAAKCHSETIKQRPFCVVAGISNKMAL